MRAQLAEMRVQLESGSNVAVHRSQADLRLASTPVGIALERSKRKSSRAAASAAASLWFPSPHVMSCHAQQRFAGFRV